MKIWLFLGIFLIYTKHINAQELRYKDSVELLIEETRKGNKIYHDKDTEAKRMYYFNKRSKEVVTIIIAPTNRHSAFHYSFINGQLLRIRLYLPYTAIPSSIGKKMYGSFYYRNGILADKNVLNFPELDMEQFYQKGLALYSRAIEFLRSKIDN